MTLHIHKGLNYSNISNFMFRYHTFSMSMGSLILCCSGVFDICFNHNKLGYAAVKNKPISTWLKTTTVYFHSCYKLILVWLAALFQIVLTLRHWIAESVHKNTFQTLMCIQITC